MWYIDTNVDSSELRFNCHSPERELFFRLYLWDLYRFLSDVLDIMLLSFYMYNFHELFYLQIIDCFSFRRRYLIIIMDNDLLRYRVVCDNDWRGVSKYSERACRIGTGMQNRLNYVDKWLRLRNLEIWTNGHKLNTWYVKNSEKIKIV